MTAGSTVAGPVDGRDPSAPAPASPDDMLSGARDAARELDADHAPEPDGLADIGTCRICGLLIGRDHLGTWSHRPSVGEIDSAEAWLGRHGRGATSGPSSAGAAMPRGEVATPTHG